MVGWPGLPQKMIRDVPLAVGGLSFLADVHRCVLHQVHQPGLGHTLTWTARHRPRGRALATFSAWLHTTPPVCSPRCGLAANGWSPAEHRQTFINTALDLAVDG